MLIFIFLEVVMNFVLVCFLSWIIFFVIYIIMRVWIWFCCSMSFCRVLWYCSYKNWIGFWELFEWGVCFLDVFEFLVIVYVFLKKFEGIWENLIWWVLCWVLCWVFEYWVLVVVIFFWRILWGVFEWE